jgi:formylglycine-generating enzyme required for sulfatase activity
MTATPAKTPSGGGRSITFLLRQPRLAQGFVEPRAEGLNLTLISIQPGDFLMGSPETEPGHQDLEGPQHLVRLEGFFMSQTPITQAQWRTVAQWPEQRDEHWGRALKPNPSRFVASRFVSAEARLFSGESNTDQRPVERVSWEDAMEFCHRLRQRTGRHYTLPSEAQWEYACRAGTTTPFHFGQTITPELANYNGSFTYANGPKGAYREQTTPVGMFPANAWGLRDMHGNVCEWCLDAWHDSYKGAPSDGSAWVDQEGDKRSCHRRLLRGGSWLNPPGDCRSACRSPLAPDYAFGNVGFRVVCLLQDPSLNP